MLYELLVSITSCKIMSHTSQVTVCKLLKVVLFGINVLSGQQLNLPNRGIGIINTEFFNTFVNARLLAGA